MALYDLLGQGQSEPSPTFSFCSKEWLEDGTALVGWYPVAIVRNYKLNFALTLSEAQAKNAFRRQGVQRIHN